MSDANDVDEMHASSDQSFSPSEAFNALLSDDNSQHELATSSGSETQSATDAFNALLSADGNSDHSSIQDNISQRQLRWTYDNFAHFPDPNTYIE